MVGYYDKDFNMQYKVHIANLHLENKLQVDIVIRDKMCKFVSK